MNEILNIIKNNKKTLVHCLGGKGRTAMVIFIYLMKKGHTNIYEELKNRTILLTPVQKQFIRDYTKTPLT